MRTPRAFIIVLIFASSAIGADVDYARDVKPLLHEKCSACHGALKQEAGLRLDAAVLIRKGSSGGSVIHVGDAADSLLLQRVATKDVDEQMPPEGEGERLNPQQIQLLRTWINNGAIAPEHETIPKDPQQHWAYQSPVRAAVPVMPNATPRVVEAGAKGNPGTKADSGREHIRQLPSSIRIPSTVHADWPTNPIDAFIASRQRSNGVTTVQLANKQTLVRRLYFDLIGLPPDRKQIDDFVNDTSANAYTRLVNELLSRPEYGERWGRHWMDVWRYSDWSGYKNQLRGSQRHIWRWRDWIIESLNADKGYDQMIVEMLAGDELAPTDHNVLRATGFLARNYHNSNRNIWLDATVEHTAKAFLGMTINCARCHDHKFDPLAQSEYYAMRAIFEPHNVRTERIPGQPNLITDGVSRVFDADPKAKTFLYLRGNEKHFDKESPIAPAVPAVLTQPLEIKHVVLPPQAVFPALMPHIEAEDVKRAEQQVAVAKKLLEKAQATTDSINRKSSVNVAELKRTSTIANLKSLRARWAADKEKYSGDTSDDSEALPKLAAAAERTAALEQARFDLADKQFKLAAANARQEKDATKKQAAITKANKVVVAAAKQVAIAEAATLKTDTKYTSVGKAYPATSTGRRLALAHWIANDQNPLTARVAINHIWLRHFGRPLVANTFDFGLRSPRPAHAELLDWLAVELMQNAWSMKHIHRLMVTSRTYQLMSSADPAMTANNAKVDRDNELYWRANVRRLDAEVIRDSVLHVAGSLDLKHGGADIDYTNGETINRRSIYFQHAYEKQMTMLLLFDSAGPNECYRRSESIIPQQALTLANSTLSLSESRKLARALWTEVENTADAETDFVQHAFKQILARPPSDQEVTACRKFLKQQANMLAEPTSLTDFGGKEKSNLDASPNPQQRARENMIHVLMNHNDFVTVR